MKETAMTKRAAMMSGAMLITTGIGSCATGAGDEVTCPACDNVTELLVGNRCVPIDQVEACGPDGHAHGGECHCFSGQQPTEIGGTHYCLQTECTSEQPVDLHEHACGLLEDTPESATAVGSFADFEDAHADRDTLVAITLPGGTGYVHFPSDETGHVLVFLDTAGVFSSAYDAAQNPLDAVNLGANEDCGDDFPEVWDVHVENDTGSVQPQILGLDGTGTVRVVILEE